MDTQTRDVHFYITLRVKAKPKDDPRGRFAISDQGYPWPGSRS